MQQKNINQHMIQAAMCAGKVLKSAFNSKSLEVISKSVEYHDVMSVADTDAESAIIKILTSKLPTTNILSEEMGYIDRGSVDTIVVDPLDGSSNFLLGLPHFSVSLVHIHNGTATASVVFSPILKKLYFAENGKGASLNNEKLESVSNIEKHSLCVAVNFSHETAWIEKQETLNKINDLGVGRILRNGSPNLDFCLLAEGRIDAVVSSDSLMYDFAPGYLIAKESGCFEYPVMGPIESSKESKKSFVIGNDRLLSERLFNL